MTPEVREKWTEAWREAQKAKDERRKANRERWAQRRDWSDDHQHKAGIGADVEPDDNAGGSASLRKMRAIMVNEAIPLYRRLGAAEVVLSYELGAGAGVGVDPETIAAASFKFLRAVADNASTPDALKFRALRSVVAVENARAQAKSGNVTFEEKRYLLLNLINAERVRALRQAGTWNTVLNESWALTGSDEFDWPSGWPGSWQWSPSSISSQLANSHDTEAFRRELLSIKAKNRPDLWEQYLVPVPSCESS
jgi:hypothetical protein